MIQTLDSDKYSNPIARVELLGMKGTLAVKLPPEKPNDYAYAFEIV